ncbi:YicC/YloC family endoribonuclease [Megamonas sp.]
MPRSMTGFGSAQFDDGTYKIGVEMKAVNNRYRDVSVRMPSVLRPLETDIINVLNKYNLRGKIDIFINFVNNSDNKKQLSVDKDLLAAYYNSLQEIEATVKKLHKKAKFDKVSLLDLAAYPGIINEEDVQLNLEEIKPLLLNTVTEATDTFVKMKINEGENLKKDLISRTGVIANLVQQIRTAAPERLENYRAHLIETLHSLLAETDIDENRIIQECAIMADKMDITEELVRMDSHLQQFGETLNTDGNIGRKMDFIVQEMNRETNTMASKANNALIAKLVVEIKGELEKIREQIQNIE